MANNKDEIAKQNAEIKRLQELAKQYDIDTLKQNAKEISDKIEDLLDKQKYLESDIDEKKRSLKKIEERLTANDDKLKAITNQIEEEESKLKKIKERKEKALDLPFV